MNEIEITTGYNELPKDTQSALAEINALLNVSLAAINNPKDFIGADIPKIEILKAYRILQKMLIDKEYK